MKTRYARAVLFNNDRSASVHRGLSIATFRVYRIYGVKVIEPIARGVHHSPWSRANKSPLHQATIARIMIDSSTVR